MQAKYKSTLKNIKNQNMQSQQISTEIPKKTQVIQVRIKNMQN